MTTPMCEEGACIRPVNHDSPHAGWGKDGYHEWATRPSKPTLRPEGYLTLAQFHRLNWAVMPVQNAFGRIYMVGSVLRHSDYRDVDLRCPMAPRLDGTDFTIEGHRLLVLNCAISDWLATITRLPIDFQFQSEEDWLASDLEGRNPMGVPRGY